MVETATNADVVYASSLRRARESAILIAKGRPLVVLPELVEISLGEWDGLSWAEIERRYPELAARKLLDWFAVAPPEGEAWPDFTARVDRALEQIRSGPLPAAVVAHLTVNAWIAHRVAGQDPMRFTQDYGQCYTYEL